MNKVSKKILSLLTFIILISFVLDKIAYYSIKKIEENVYTGQNVGKFNQYLKTKDSVEFLFFGSSRTNRHFNPDIFSNSAFNMGVDGRQLAFTWTAIKILPRAKRQVIILNLDPSNIYNPNYDGDDLMSLNYQFHKSDKIKSELVKLKDFNPLIHYYWCIGYNGKLMSILVNAIRPKYDHQSYNGFDPLFLTDQQKEIRNKKFKSYSPTNDCAKNVSKIMVNQNSLNYLNNIIEFCKENNKDLYVVTTPTYKDFCKSDNKKLTELLGVLDVKYWDFSDFFNQNDNFEIWKDQLHLSSQGANIFSQHFNEIIKGDNSYINN